MKYFKYPFKPNINKRILKERVAQLSKQKRRNYYLYKTINFCNKILYFILVGSLLLLINEINIFKGFIKILLFILTFLISGVVCLWLLFLYSRLFSYEQLPKINSEIINISTKKLKNYYKLNEDYIITKCYFCSNSVLINRDVIIFIVGNKIRIINDFTRSIYDFGCYELSKDEITYGYVEYNGLVSTVIKSNNFVIQLGKRAKPFINKNLFNLY